MCVFVCVCVCVCVCVSIWIVARLNNLSFLSEFGSRRLLDLDTIHWQNPLTEAESDEEKIQAERGSITLGKSAVVALISRHVLLRSCTTMQKNSSNGLSLEKNME